MVRESHGSKTSHRVSQTIEQRYHHICSFSSIPTSPTSILADRYLLRVLRRARNRFVHHRELRSKFTTSANRSLIDNQSDSGIFTSSSQTNYNDDLESNSFQDIDDGDVEDTADEDELSSFQPDDSDNELLCESLEAVLMETLLELRQHRQQRFRSSQSSKSFPRSEPVLVTRL